jgi:lipopolysaccharide transport system ATP-binding protein
LVWIDEAHIESNHQMTDLVLCGQALDFVIHYSAIEPGLNAAFFIGIYNAFGEKILHLGTHYGFPGTFTTKEKGEIICTIPRLPLAAGQYSVNLSFHINGQSLERITNAFSFTIENGDFFGNGKLPDVAENKFLVDQIWQIN